MKTIRTIIATLSAELLVYALVALLSVRRNAAFIQRTIYQGFDQTFVVALVMGCAFLLIAVILTVAIVSTEGNGEDEDEEEDEEYEEEEEDDLPRRRPRDREDRRSGEAKLASVRSDEQPYRRVSRDRAMDQKRASKASEDGFARPRARSGERPAPERAPMRRERAAERPDEIYFPEDDGPVRKVRKTARPTPPPEQEDEFVELEETVAVPAFRPRPAAPAARPVSPAQPGSRPVKAAPRPRPAAAPKPEEETPEPTIEIAPKEETPEPTIEIAPEEETPEPTIEIAPKEETPEPATEIAPKEETPEPATEAEEEPNEAPQTIPESPEAEEEPDEAPEAGPEAPEREPDVRPARSEGTVRCVFCGSTISRSCLFCPHCGKKR